MEYHPVGSKENLEGLNRETYLQEGWDSGQAISLGGPCWKAYWRGCHSGHSPLPLSKPAGSFLGFLCENLMVLRLVQVSVSHPPPHAAPVFRAQQLLTLMLLSAEFLQAITLPAAQKEILMLSEFAFLPRFIRGGTALRLLKSLRKSPISVCSTSPITRIGVVTSKFFMWWGNLHTYYLLLINCIYLHIHLFCMDGFMPCMWGSEDSLQLSVLFFRYVRPREPTLGRAW